MRIYQVKWQERTRPCCKICCSEENHPWIEHISQVETSPNVTQSVYEDKINRRYEEPNSSIEIGDVEILFGDVEWKES